MCDWKVNEESHSTDGSQGMKINVKVGTKGQEIWCEKNKQTTASLRIGIISPFRFPCISCSSLRLLFTFYDSINHTLFSNQLVFHQSLADFPRIRPEQKKRLKLVKIVSANESAKSALRQHSRLQKHCSC